MYQGKTDPVLLESRVKKQLNELEERGVKIKYNPAITRLKVCGYRDNASAKLGNELFGDINDVLTYAGNNYVDSKVKKTVVKLSDCIARLTKASKEYPDLNKIEKDRDKILKKIKIAEGNKGMIKEETIKAVQSVIDAADALIAYYPEKEKLVENLKLSKEAAEQIKATIEGAVDNSSKDAATYSYDIMKWMYTWRNNASLLFCGTDDVKGLNEAQKIAEKWNSLSLPKSRRDVAKDNEIKRFNPDGELKNDIVRKILMGRSNFEKLENLKDAVADYNKSTATRYDVTSIKAQITENENKIDALQNRKRQIVVALQNGEVTKERVYGELKSIDAETNKLKVETYGGTVQRPDGRVTTIGGLQGKVDEARSYADDRNEFIEVLNEPINKLELYKDDIGNFVTLMTKVDVRNLIGLLRGRNVSKEDLTQAVESLNSVIIREIEEMNARGEAIRTTEQMQDYVSEVMRERTPSLEAISNGRQRRGETVYVPNEGVKAESGSLNSEMDDYFAQLLNEQPAEAEQQKNQNNVSRLINLDDDK